MRSINADVVQDARRIEFAGRLDQSSAHQRLECRIAHRIKTEDVESAGQRLPQQLAGVPAHHRIPAGTDLRLRSQAKFQRLLTGVDLAPRHRDQRRQLALRVRGPNVLQDPPLTADLLHDLHSRRSRRRLHLPHERAHTTKLQPG